MANGRQQGIQAGPEHRFVDERFIVCSVQLQAIVTIWNEKHCGKSKKSAITRPNTT